MTFYGTIEKVEVNGSAVVLRCVREFYHADGLLPDDVWLWTVSDAAPATNAQALVGCSICGFEVEDRGLKVWLDEGDESAVVEGSPITKVEEARSRADLERVIGDLSHRIQRDEREYLALTKKIREIAATIYQKVDRLERRAAFEAQRRSESPKEFSREIEDLLDIVRRLEEPNQITGPNAGGPRQLPIPTPPAARVGQF